MTAGNCLGAVKEDSDAAFEIAARMERNGFDLSAINAEVFLQARESFGLFDELMKSTQPRLIMLREIAMRRELEKSNFRTTACDGRKDAIAR